MARASAAEWAKRVERWKASGLTANEFAAETGVNPTTLSNWRRRLSKEEDGRVAGQGWPQPDRRRESPRTEGRIARAPEPRFVELPTVDVSAVRAALEIIVDEKVRIRIASDVAPSTLDRVLRAVGVAL